MIDNAVDLVEQLR